MSLVVEQAVAHFLGKPEIDWQTLKPIMCFVVLWNRLEARHGQHLNLSRIETSASSAIASSFFDIAAYRPHISFFQERYQESPHRLSVLLRTGQEPIVQQRVEDLIAGNLTNTKDLLLAILMIPYRIRNNLFHGRKDTFQLYAQAELFSHVNEVLCLFHADLNEGR